MLMTSVAKVELRKEMKKLKAKGECFEHLATCPCSYQIYLKVLYSKTDSKKLNDFKNL